MDEVGRKGERIYRTGAIHQLEVRRLVGWGPSLLITLKWLQRRAPKAVAAIPILPLYTLTAMEWMSRSHAFSQLLTSALRGKFRTCGELVSQNSSAKLGTYRSANVILSTNPHGLKFRARIQLHQTLPQGRHPEEERSAELGKRVDRIRPRQEIKGPNEPL
jgi:hypothetical protein